MPVARESHRHPERIVVRKSESAEILEVLLVGISNLPGYRALDIELSGRFPAVHGLAGEGHFSQIPVAVRETVRETVVKFGKSVFTGKIHYRGRECPGF